MAAAPYGLINSALARHTKRIHSAKQRKSFNDAMEMDNPEVAAKLRALYPDFDEHMAVVRAADYKHECSNDARFATKYRVPPGVGSSFVGKQHNKGIDAVCVTNSGFLTAGHDSVKLWERDEVVQNRVFSAYDATIASGERFGVLVGPDGYEFINVKNLSPKRKMTQDEGTIHCCKLRADTKIATGDQHGVLNVHDVETGRNTFSWMSHGSCITNVGWRDDNILATSSRDGKVTIWDIRKNPHASFIFLPSVRGNAVSIKPSFELTPHLNYAVFDVAFHGPNSLLTCGADNALRRWDLRYDTWTSTEHMKFLGHTAPIRKLVVSPNGKFITTCCENGSARVFMLDELAWRKKQERSKINVEKLNSVRRDGFSSAVFSLNGHNGIVSNCAWKSDSTIYTCSWDQTVQRFELPQDLGDF